MKHLQQIASGVDVIPLLLAIKQHPELWDEFTPRKAVSGSPHTAMQDIWVRYNDIRKFQDGDLTHFNDPHYPVWYPAYDVLPQLRPITPNFSLSHPCPCGFHILGNLPGTSRFLLGGY